MTKNQKKDFETMFVQLSTANNFVFSPEFLTAARIYYAVLINWNQGINLTKNEEQQQFIIENLLDPVLACKNYVNKMTDKDDALSRGAKIIDLGCGGGFVGLFWYLYLTLGCLLAPRRLVLVDSNRKKISFCKEVIRQLGLSESVGAVQMRAENLELNDSFPSGNGTLCSQSELLCNQFDIVLSRATWSFEGFVSHALPFAKSGGCLVSFEGPSGVSAMKESGAKILEYKVLPTTHARYLGVTNTI